MTIDAALFNADYFRAWVPNAIPDPVVTDMIAIEQSFIESFFGSATASRTQLLRGGADTGTYGASINNVSIYLTRPISLVTSIYEDYTNASNHATATPLVNGTDYRIWSAEGRIERRGPLYPLIAPADVPPSPWLPEVEIIWTPVDDTPERKRACVELVRIAVSRNPFTRESVAGEYTIEAPDWEEARKILIMNMRPYLPRM